jgi:hypothetical protein
MILIAMTDGLVRAQSSSAAQRKNAAAFLR